MFQNYERLFHFDIIYSILYMLCIGKKITAPSLDCFAGHLKKPISQCAKQFLIWNWFRITKLSTKTIISAAIVQYLASYFRDPVKVAVFCHQHRSKLLTWVCGTVFFCSFFRLAQAREFREKAWKFSWDPETWCYTFSLCMFFFSFPDAKEIWLEPT